MRQILFNTILPYTVTVTVQSLPQKATTIIGQQQRQNSSASSFCAHSFSHALWCVSTATVGGGAIERYYASSRSSLFFAREQLAWRQKHARPSPCAHTWRAHHNGQWPLESSHIDEHERRRRQQPRHYIILYTTFCPYHAPIDSLVCVAKTCLRPPFPK